VALKDEAEALCKEISAEQMRLSRLAWTLERVIHRLRLAQVGSSGIQHRVIETKEEVLDELAVLVIETRNQWKQFPLDSGSSVDRG
jgi:hypothetical protein